MSSPADRRPRNSADRAVRGALRRTDCTWPSRRETSAAQTFDSHLVEDRGDGRRGSTSLPGAGKRAITHVRPLERLTAGRCSNAASKRAARIRSAFTSPKPAIRCTATRNTARLCTPERRERMRRLALHAATLGFDHPSDGRRLRFESPPPREFQAIVSRLAPMTQCRKRDPGRPKDLRGLSVRLKRDGPLRKHRSTSGISTVDA